MKRTFTIAAFLAGILSACILATPAAAQAINTPVNSPVLVLPFTPRTDTSPAWIGDSLAATLRDELQRSGVTLANPPADANAVPLATTDHALAQAQATGARTVIFGTYQVLGWELSVDGQVLDVATGQVTGELHASDALRDRLAVEADLTAQMSQALALAPAAPGEVHPGREIARIPAQPAQDQLPYDDQAAVQPEYVPQYDPAPLYYEPTVYYPVDDTIVYPAYSYSTVYFGFGYPYRYHSRYYHRPWHHHWAHHHHHHGHHHWHGRDHYSRWDYRADRRDHFDDRRDDRGHRGDRFRDTVITRSHSGRELTGRDRETGRSPLLASVNSRESAREDWRRVYPRDASRLQSTDTREESRIVQINRDGKRTTPRDNVRDSNRDATPDNYDARNDRFRDPTPETSAQKRNRVIIIDRDKDKDARGSKTEARSDSKDDVRSEPRADSRKEPRSDTKDRPDPKPEARPRPEPRPEARPEARPEPRPEPKPRPAPRADDAPRVRPRGGDDARQAPPPRRAEPEQRPSRGREAAPPPRASEPPARSRGDSGASRGSSRSDSGASRGSDRGGSFRDSPSPSRGSGSSRSGGGSSSSRGGGSSRSGRGR